MGADDVLAEGRGRREEALASIEAGRRCSYRRHRGRVGGGVWTERGGACVGGGRTEVLVRTVWRSSDSVA